MRDGSLPPITVREAIDRLFQFSMPLIVACKGLEVPPYLIQRANQEQVPVLRFGEDAYLNPYAEVFRPAAALPGLELPLVEGPAGSEKLLLERFGEADTAILVALNDVRVDPEVRAEKLPKLPRIEAAEVEAEAAKG